MANSFKNYLTPNVGTSDTTVLTGATGAATTVIGFSISNTTSLNITVSAKLTSGATTCFIVKEATVLPGSTLVCVGGDQKLSLAAGDLIKVSASAATSADVILSVLEIT
jgi:hypothetical protein